MSDKNFFTRPISGNKNKSFQNVANVLEENVAFTMTIIGGSLEVNVGL